MRFFLIVALSIWTAMHVYVFWRARSVPVISRHVSRYLLAAVACFLWASYILAHILDHFRMGVLARIPEVIGANWIGILFLLLVALLALDLVTLFGWLWPRFAPASEVGPFLPVCSFPLLRSCKVIVHQWLLPTKSVWRDCQPKWTARCSSSSRTFI